MSKELEALQTIRSLTERSQTSDQIINGLVLIETALKRLEKLEKPKEIVGTTTIDKSLERFLLNHCPQLKEKLEKQDEILRIIKEKEVDIVWLKLSRNLIEYNFHFKDLEGTQYRILTQAEYDLLKRWLK